MLASTAVRPACTQVIARWEKTKNRPIWNTPMESTAGRSERRGSAIPRVAASKAPVTTQDSTARLSANQSAVVP